MPLRHKRMIGLLVSTFVPHRHESFATKTHLIALVSFVLLSARASLYLQISKAASWVNISQ